MYRFFESIRLYDGQLELLDLHEERMARTHSKFFKTAKKINLLDAIKIDEKHIKGLFKVKVIYSRAIEEVQIEPYSIKKVTRVLLFDDNNIEYAYKYVDRASLERPFNSIETTDTDVIFIKNGCLTDASYANIALFDGLNWFTPTNCLFEGVKRSFLIKRGILHECVIKIKDLPSYTKIAFINAMKDFEDIYSYNVVDDFLILKLEE